MSTSYGKADRIAFLFSIVIHVKRSNYQLHQYSEPVVIQTRSQSRDEIKHTHETPSSKLQQFPLIEKKLFGP